jgi:hypothetical protein
MSIQPRYFVLQARDPDHGSPVFEARFAVTEPEDLRALLGMRAADGPQSRQSRRPVATAPRDCHMLVL